MSSRGQPAPSPPVQIAQQPRPNTAAARGQTPPTGYGQQEEYGQVYQQQQQQQQSLYQTPPGVPSQNYEISKQNFVVPSTQNQGGQAAQMAGMYPQNPSMRTNQPVSRMQTPTYPNLTSQTQQSVMYPMPHAQHMQYNQQQRYNSPTIYYPNQHGQSNMHTPTTVPATREKKKLITIPDPNTKQDVTSKVHHLDEPAPATSDSRSSETPNSAVQEPSYSSRPPGQVRPNFSQSQQNQQNQNMSYQQPQLGYIFTNSPQSQQAQSQLFMPGGMSDLETKNEFVSKVAAEFASKVAERLYTGGSQQPPHQPSPSPSQEQQQQQQQAKVQSPPFNPNQTSVPPPQEQQPQQQPQQQPKQQPQQQPQQQPKQQPQQPKSSQVKSSTPPVVPNDRESVSPSVPTSQVNIPPTEAPPPPKVVANNVDPVINTKSEEKPKPQPSSAAPAVTAAPVNKAPRVEPVKAFTPSTAPVPPGKTFASQVKQQPPPSSDASKIVNDKSNSLTETVPVTAAAPPPSITTKEEKSSSPRQPAVVDTKPAKSPSPEVTPPVVTQKPNEPVSMATVVAAGKKPSEPTSAKPEKPAPSVEPTVPVREKTPEVNIVPPSPSEKDKAKESSPLPSTEPEVTAKEPPKKDRLTKKAFNQKGDSKIGSDMDAFKDSLPEECKPTSGANSTPTAVEKENTDPKPNKAASAEREPSPVIKEKEMSPADEKVKKVEVKTPQQQSSPTEDTTDNTKNEDDAAEDMDEDDAANDLKYKYSEDQWSPLNPEGKKHYDREFLLQFQFASEAVVKPAGLPEIPDIILDKPHPVNAGPFRREFSDSGNRGNTSQRGGGGGNDGFDFTPNYVWGQGPAGGRGGQGQGQNQNQNQVPKRMSGQKNIRIDRGQGGPRQISLSLSKDVDLHHAEKAWKPGHKDTGSKDKDKEAPVGDEDANTQDMYKKTRSILNKLTPQKFQTLIVQMQALAIDTESKLKGVIDLVFEKAVSEPNFSVAYANMCRCLSMFKVPSESKEGDTVNFRAVLLTRCQREFEKDKSSEALFVTKRKEMAEEADVAKKEELKVKLQYEETQAKRRSLGNIRFIGELFKLKMLTETIMHDCVFKLLRTKDAENLECLCRLLTTIGKELDTDRARPRMEQYFHQMGKIVGEKKTSARVRFMLQDVIDLRKGKWVPRRDDNNPKTIDQIHKEVAKEAQDRAINSQNVMIQQKANKGSSQGDNRGRRGPGPQGGPMGMGGSEGWNTVGNRQQPLRAVDRTIDPSKMKISKPQQVDETIQLGPGGGAARFGGWGRGSTGGGARASQESERPSNPNRFSALGSKPEEESGRRGFGGSSPARTDGRGRGGFSRPTMLSTRHSQESEREKAIAAVKSIGVSQSVDGGRRERSRGREQDKGRPMAPPAEPEIPLLSSDEISKKTIAILDEYLHIQDMKEALLCVKELPQGNHADFVTSALNHVLERSEVARRQTGLLLHDLVKKSLFSVNSYLKGIKEVLEFAEDMAIDIPKIWKYLGELIGPMIQDGSVPLSFLKEACEPLKESNKAGVLVAEVLHDASHREGHKKVAELWSTSSLQWTDFVAKNQVEEFIIEKKLEFTKGGSSAPTTPTTGLPLDKVATNLQMLVNQKADNEQIFDWIESNVDEPTTKQKKFIRALMTAVCSSAIKGEGSNAKVEPEVIHSRNDLLQKYLDHQAESELQALFALQALVTKLEHPPGVLRQMFDTLYDEDIISEDAFIQWEKSDDPQEQEGKGVAMKQVVQFFTWLAEADEDGES